MIEQDEDDLLFEHPASRQRQPDTVKHTQTKVLSGEVKKIETIVTPVEEKEALGEKGCQEELEKYRAPAQPYTGIAVESKLNNQLDMIAFMEGRSWKVEYFQQLIALDDTPMQYSKDSLAAYQQYHRIKQFEIRMDGDLNYDHQTEFDESSLTGTGKILPLIKPNVGDVFIADIGDGRAGLFVVDSVKRLSARKNSVLEIDYSLREYITVLTHKNLIEKSVATYIFNMDGLIAGGEGMIEEGQFNVLGELEGHLDRLVRLYFAQFFDHERMSFTVPLGNDHPSTYDHGQVDFVNRIIDKTRYPMYRQLRMSRVEANGLMPLMTLWDAIINQSYMMIDDTMTKFNVVSRSAFRGADRQFNAWHGLYQQYIFPPEPHHIEQAMVWTDDYTARAQLPIFGQVDEQSLRKYIHPIGMAQDYVFSHAFYMGDTDNMSVIEYLIYEFMHKRPICPVGLNKLIAHCVRWNDLERYYYIPLIIMMIQALLNGYGLAPMVPANNKQDENKTFNQPPKVGIQATLTNVDKA